MVDSSGGILHADVVTNWHFGRVLCAASKSQPTMPVSASFGPSAVSVDTAQSTRAVVRPTTASCQTLRKPSSDISKQRYKDSLRRNSRSQGPMPRTVALGMMMYSPISGI